MPQLEDWKPVPGFEAYYLVSNVGRVYSTRKAACLAQTPDKDGYLQVGLRIDGRVKTAKVHRLVALAFIGEAPLGRPEVDHRDGDRAHNHVNNLRWSSGSENKLNRHGCWGASGVIGIRFRPEKPNPWQAYTSLNGRFRSLGHYPTCDAAKAARLAEGLAA